MEAKATLKESRMSAVTDSAETLPWRPSELARKLAEAAAGMPLLLALKTRYRPYICPLEWVLSEIPERARLYDIGCGTGALLYLAQACRQVTIAHGYDVDALTVAQARHFQRDKEATDFEAVCLPIGQTPPDVSAYDTVTMIDVLHHIAPDRQQDFLNRLADGMSSGGRLVFKDIDASRFFGRLMNQLHDLVLAREWVHPRSRLETVEMLEKAGLRILSHETRWSLWYPHFLVVALKP